VLNVDKAKTLTLASAKIEVILDKTPTNENSRTASTFMHLKSSSRHIESSVIDELQITDNSSSVRVVLKIDFL